MPEQLPPKCAAMTLDLHTRYRIESRKYRTDFSKAGAYAGIVLVMLGIGLDYALYPEDQYLFGIVRLGVSLLMGLIIVALSTPWGRRQVEKLSFCLFILPQIMITWMIAETEGANSMYSLGLYLSIFAASVALPFGFRYNLALSVVTLVLYIAACAVHPATFMLHGAFVVNALILSFVITVSLFSAFFNEKARFQLFRLRTAVAEKNVELEKTNRDLTEIKGQLMQQEKMAAIGTLAAGLLHEVNNPVNYSLMAVNLALENPSVQANGEIKECLTDAREGMLRIQHIVSDLKTFAYRPHEAEARSAEFPLERAVGSSLRLLGHDLSGIEIKRELPADTQVQGDEAAIIGVLVNLLGNAALAVNQSAHGAPSIRITAKHERDRLQVAVEDNGPGIPPERLQRIFEPFFTTREIGQGLGLGLSISYSVIERHGGILRAESEAGKGTRMTFDLPRTI